MAFPREATGKAYSNEKLKPLIKSTPELLKLIGNKRLSHIGAYDQEPGFGSFAGLNILPKQTYMNTYSCRCSETQLMELQQDILSLLQKKISIVL